MGQLDGKVAVVTGASDGIGFASALRFAEEGAYVYLTGRRKPELDEAVVRIGAHRASGVQGDVKDLADLDRLFATVGADGRRIDVLFANAGGAPMGPLAAVTVADYEHATEVNLRSALFTVQKALPLLNDNASVILCSSTTAGRGAAGVGLYSAAKAGVRSLTRSWANELKDRGIRVNALAPGVTDTSLVRGNAPAGVSPDEFLAMLATMVPLGRNAEVAEQAAVALFLASDQSSFMTGSELSVDGGVNQI
ncbi:oxidoreductase [Asanoa ishikariensis]|uniref:NAD(P)-dependent dehydrogenase, short-chain alcohol dehydrogenase family n=1 Tax=Asanoa ishikariensis TaxID=137265 RepID=A0A1H3UIY3_9ACTN|nr:SDR family oxidoreductase [Asanoa ishikariensis]GIF63418.1 oxidoreductase [Asanoa ishikariensis]SDZ62267.1 NAD(P)-dependent dehydrogenase, short-chain alcohol dehydrogenase family [Asanoa ishikariensis]